MEESNSLTILLLLLLHYCKHKVIVLYIVFIIGRHGKRFLNMEKKIVHFRRLVVFEKEVYLVH